MSRLAITALAVFASLAVPATDALAYGPEGHALVADMAQLNLNPSALAETLRLLALENAKGLDDVSSWADDYRSTHPETAQSHFVDIPLTEQSYDEQRDCHFDKDGKHSADATCVVARLAFFAQVLADHTRPDADRLVALKWVTHLVGDIHQPLHAEDNLDRGGNSIGMVFNGKANTNLHAVWDGGMIEQTYGWTLGPNYSFDHVAVKKAADDLNAAISADQRRSWMPRQELLANDIVQWANESHTLAEAAYLSLPTARSDGWDTRYQALFWPVVRLQLEKASVRLAAVLNGALGSGDRCPGVAGVAFYAGPWAGTEDQLAPEDIYQDAFCAAQFRKLRYPHGFVGVYGSARILESNRHENKRFAAANDALYKDVRAFAARWTKSHGAAFPILTGAGPGLMEAASRGATDAGGPSIGYTTYYGPSHDPRTAFWQYTDAAGHQQRIVDDGLIFTSVAVRESSMLAHSAALVIAPGGTGTEWEIFQAIETLKSNELTPVPVYLVGSRQLYWARFYSMVDDLVARGTLTHDEFYSRVQQVDSLATLFPLLEKQLIGP